MMDVQLILEGTVLVQLNIFAFQNGTLSPAAISGRGLVDISVSQHESCHL
jgi:hypothetical protein